MKKRKELTVLQTNKDTTSSIHLNLQLQTKSKWCYTESLEPNKFSENIGMIDFNQGILFRRLLLFIKKAGIRVRVSGIRGWNSIRREPFVLNWKLDGIVILFACDWTEFSEPWFFLRSRTY